MAILQELEGQLLRHNMNVNQSGTQHIYNMPYHYLVNLSMRIVFRTLYFCRILMSTLCCPATLQAARNLFHQPVLSKSPAFEESSKLSNQFRQF